ncbi:MATE family efflux transporter [Bradyrhizobium sp. USDA 3650]
MALMQLGQVAMMATNVALIGRIGVEALAAAALGGTIYFVGVYFGTGLLAPVAAFAARAFAEDNLGVVRRALRMGLWAALIVSVPIIGLLLTGEQMLLVLDQAPGAARLAQEYLFGLGWGALPALWFAAIRSFMVAVKRPKPVLWITVAAVPVNAMLVYVLIWGECGLPTLGLFGAGLGTALVNCATFLTSLWYVTMGGPFRDYRVLARLWRPDWTMMRQLILIGTPVSIAFLTEYGVVSAAALMMGVIGTTAVAAHQITFQVATILIRIPFGIGIAASVRVGHALGRKDGPGIQRAGLAAMFLGVVIAAVLTIGVITARSQIAELFLGETVDDANATTGLAAHLLLIGSSSFIPAAMYSVAAGSLRGLKDTRVPLLFALIGYWFVGCCSSYILGLKIGLGASGVWMGLSIGTAVYAALLIIRFQLLVSRITRQSVCFTV